jgi:hypothetical protein
MSQSLDRIPWNNTVVETEDVIKHPGGACVGAIGGPRTYGSEVSELSSAKIQSHDMILHLHEALAFIAPCLHRQHIPHFNGCAQ